MKRVRQRMRLVVRQRVRLVVRLVVKVAIHRVTYALRVMVRARFGVIMVLAEFRYAYPFVF